MGRNVGKDSIQKPLPEIGEVTENSHVNRYAAWHAWQNLEEWQHTILYGNDVVNFDQFQQAFNNGSIGQYQIGLGEHRL